MEKVQANFTVPADIKERFDRFCDKHGFNKSAVIAQQMVEWMYAKKKQGLK